MNPNNIQQYIVQIFYNNMDNFKAEGSGVIINTKKKMNYFYIFTAKHTFFTEGMEIKDMKITEISKIGIKIKNFDTETICDKENIIEIIEIDNESDFLIIVCEKNEYLKEVNLLAINKLEFNKCIIYGFPKLKEKDEYSSMDIPCKSPKFKNKIFEVYSEKPLASLQKFDTTQNAKGLSGAGVYSKYMMIKYYLSGIQIKGANGNHLVCLDIRTLSDKINEALIKKEKKPIGIFSKRKIFKIISVLLFVGLVNYTMIFLYNKYLESNQIYKYHKKLIHSKYKSPITGGIVIKTKKGKKLTITDTENGTFEFESKQESIIITFKVKGKPYERTIFPIIGDKNVLLPIP